MEGSDVSWKFFDRWRSARDGRVEGEVPRSLFRGCVQRLLWGFHIFDSQDGYALASVLLLLTMLSLCAASVITVQYVGRQSTFIGIARLKAEYAAESGIIKSIAQLHSESDLSSVTRLTRRTYLMPDESEAQVEIIPWGAFVVVRAEGRFHAFTTTRTAIVADHPSNVFNNALVFANPSHQLVMTGLSSIEGNVIVGQPGVTIGNLRNYTSPLKILVKGTIEKKQNPELPVFDPPHLKQQLELFLRLLSGKTLAGQVDDPTVVRLSAKDHLTLSTTISDSTKHVFVNGDVVINDSITRREIPLYIAVSGKVTLRKNSQIHGLIAIISSSDIIVEPDAGVDQALLCSRRSILLQEGTRISAQMIAPSIVVHKRSAVQYSSLLLSTLMDPLDTLKQDITLEDGVTVEGFVAMSSVHLDPRSEPLITVRPNASVTGAIYSTTKVSLDGSVIGTVMTKDFYFYEEPTMYLGWLRSAMINRSKLPEGFFVPPGLSDEVNLDVLDWL
ncbi:MAG: hypothetical protein HYR76_04180 [Ignavibacteria bacterium]|nr:hypothetical protein [Ignavibacteria bacterium]